MLNRTIAAAALLFFAFAAFAADAPLTRVESKQVCMINEHHMKSDQIPVEVDGKTYYGCCAMCKKALAEKPETRVATDPLSGKQVDKAVAVIAADAEGKVYYFENAKNLEKYNEKAAAKK
ncbi:MAG TPA: TRASH domain-containing protein [Thermoanaerobaculia bacterium]|jgi:YHS domain-containing protein